MTDAWVDACSIDDVEEEDVMGVKIGDTSVAVYNVEGEFFASSDICTHGQACLSEGIVIGDVIECPLHQGRFKIQTGKALGAPVSEALKTFSTKVENGRVFVSITQ
jgi:naphthalene 1,2-dioxygenase system ferredoxin subunit